MVAVRAAAEALALDAHTPVGAGCDTASTRGGLLTLDVGAHLVHDTLLCIELGASSLESGRWRGLRRLSGVVLLLLLGVSGLTQRGKERGGASRGGELGGSKDLHKGRGAGGEGLEVLVDDGLILLGGNFVRSLNVRTHGGQCRGGLCALGLEEHLLDLGTGNGDHVGARSHLRREVDLGLKGGRLLDEGLGLVGQRRDGGLALRAGEALDAATEVVDAETVARAIVLADGGLAVVALALPVEALVAHAHSCGVVALAAAIGLTAVRRARARGAVVTAEAGIHKVQGHGFEEGLGDDGRHDGIIGLARAGGQALRLGDGARESLVWSGEGGDGLRRAGAETLADAVDAHAVARALVGANLFCAVGPGEAVLAHALT